MILRVGRLVRAEFLKLFAQPFFTLAVVVLATATAFAAWSGPAWNHQRETEWRSFHAVQLFAYGFKIGLPLATVLLLVFSCMLFAGEFDRGTIKNLLTRPVTRTDLFAAKVLTMLGLGAILFGTVLVVSAGYGLARGNLGPLWDDQIYKIQRTEAVILSHAAKAVWLVLPAFCAAGALGLLVSNVTQSSGYAVAIGLVPYLLGWLITGSLKPSVQHKVFLHYPSYATDKLTDLAQGTTTRWDAQIDASRSWLWSPLAYVALFLPLAYLIFRRRNIQA